MSELRWNPLLGTWTVVASHRQDRPLLPTDHCPFCPGSGLVPDDYDILAYDNDFPSFMMEPTTPDVRGTRIQPVAPALGKCEVTLYSPEHDLSLHDLPPAHVEKLVEHWTERYRSLGNDPNIDYVFIFENRGEEVGVTIHHPHGQIYAHSFIPLKIERELQVAREYRDRTGNCLFCDLLAEEESIGERILYENDRLIAFLPSFAQHPYDVVVIPRKHIGSLLDMGSSERRALAVALRSIAGGYDRLFNKRFPYMMNMHQVPTDGLEYPYYHYHVEFYSPRRSADKLKYDAASESGSWVHIDPARPEDTAVRLRKAIEEFEGSDGT